MEFTIEKKRGTYQKLNGHVQNVKEGHLPNGRGALSHNKICVHCAYLTFDNMGKLDILKWKRVLDRRKLGHVDFKRGTYERCKGALCRRGIVL